VNGWTHKRKQLYLYGPTGTNKSSVVSLLLHENNLVYRPSQDSWPFSGLQSQHQIIVWDEYVHLPQNESELKLVLEGQPCAIRRKGLPSIVIACRIPFIFISNYPPPDNNAILSRLIVCCTEGQKVYTSPDSQPALTMEEPEIVEEQETLYLPPILDIQTTENDDDDQWEDVSEGNQDSVC